MFVNIGENEFREDLFSQSQGLVATFSRNQRINDGESDKTSILRHAPCQIGFPKPIQQRQSRCEVTRVQENRRESPVGPIDLRWHREHSVNLSRALKGVYCLSSVPQHSVNVSRVDVDNAQYVHVFDIGRIL
jgi:hypothetical protein